MKRDAIAEEEVVESILNHKEQLYRIAFSYLKNEHDALEAIQEVSCRAFVGYKKIKNSQYFQTWIVRVMINYCIDEKKRKSKHFSIEHNQTGTMELENESPIYINSLIEELEPKYKQVVLLKYFEDMTLNNISKVLEKPESTVKTWLYKALDKLRGLIKEEGEN